MLQKGREKRDQSAVSPVIGVILMVAITVILAAVIGTFVLGIGGNVEENARAGVNFKNDPQKEEVSVNIVTSGNVDYVLVRISAQVLNNDAPNQIRGAVLYMDEVGSQVVIDDPTFSEDSATMTAVGVIGPSPSNEEMTAGPDENNLAHGDLIASVDLKRDQVETTVQTHEFDFS